MLIEKLPIFYILSLYLLTMCNIDKFVVFHVSVNYGIILEFVLVILTLKYKLVFTAIFWQVLF